MSILSLFLAAAVAGVTTFDIRDDTEIIIDGEMRRGRVEVETTEPVHRVELPGPPSASSRSIVPSTREVEVVPGPGLVVFERGRLRREMAVPSCFGRVGKDMVESSRRLGETKLGTRTLLLGEGFWEYSSVGPPRRPSHVIEGVPCRMQPRAGEPWDEWLSRVLGRMERQVAGAERTLRQMKSDADRASHTLKSLEHQLVVASSEHAEVALQLERYADMEAGMLPAWKRAMTSELCRSARCRARLREWLDERNGTVQACIDAQRIPSVERVDRDWSLTGCSNPAIQSVQEHGATPL